MERGWFANGLPQRLSWHELSQDSLGGNCRTLFFVTLSPLSHAADESVSTLKFATRARCDAVVLVAATAPEPAILLSAAALCGLLNPQFVCEGSLSDNTITTALSVCTKSCAKSCAK